MASAPDPCQRKYQAWQDAIAEFGETSQQALDAKAAYDACGQQSGGHGPGHGDPPG